MLAHVNTWFQIFPAARQTREKMIVFKNVSLVRLSDLAPPRRVLLLLPKVVSRRLSRVRFPVTMRAEVWI